MKQLLWWLRIEWKFETEGEIAAYICLQLFQSGHLDSEQMLMLFTIDLTSSMVQNRHVPKEETCGELREHSTATQRSGGSTQQGLDDSFRFCTQLLYFIFLNCICIDACEYTCPYRPENGDRFHEVKGSFDLPDMGAGSQTQVFCKSSMHSLSHWAISPGPLSNFK